ncbi:hypothetical protein J3R30DRAFT_3343304 [Lentinula aciculospora]|uniref:F-box domain-containing protein n=1 Tax=Lentinula aciculospora TaxID=153920 RepID=A0A9W9DI26_9AGAR|nr:hypothetical protein J3R30DRAFT_3343304 [Lentinula aciculospora]
MHFSKLPPEILDYILSDIDKPSDLIALATTAKELYRIVAPRHSEYRVLRIRHRFPGLWAHLAKRVDLSRNLREINISQKTDQTLIEQYPTTLVSSPLPHGMIDPWKEEEERVQNFLVAMGYTEQLKVFRWDFRYDTGSLYMSSEQELRLLGILSKISSIERLVLAGNLRCLMPLAKNNQFQLVWNMPNLRDLTLMGDVWGLPPALPSLKHVLKQCMQLRRLQIPIEANGISDLVIPTLRQLSLFLYSGTTSSSMKQWNVFLENHPLLEDFWCNPSSTMVLPRNGLVKLKRLSAEPDFLDSFTDAERVPESLECLQYTSFQFNTGFIPPSRCNLKNLKQLHLSTAQTEEELHAIAASCPALTWLHITGCVKFELDVWLDFLSSFLNLEVFRGPGIWISVSDDSERMHVAIMRLVQRCMKLRELDHRSVHGKRGRNRKIVIIKEQTKDGLSVRYEVRRPHSRCRIDFMDDAFARSC